MIVLENIPTAVGNTSKPLHRVVIGEGPDALNTPTPCGLADSPSSVPLFADDPGATVPPPGFLKHVGQR